ncbi:hypothetical protein [Paenibacillus xylanexedens]|uniref:hypothetical protein n=1 Tax=Paenibacillus xylanexedens TaxID=528191 RepID=UPI000F529E03|nr:hypothetical protein [Paenibacillus xylanexedens]
MVQIQYARNFVDSLGVDVNVVDWKGTLGNYNRETDTISLNLRRIIQHQKRGKKIDSFKESLTEYIKIIICHELGHRDDDHEHRTLTDLINEIDENNDPKFYLLDDFCDEVKSRAISVSVEKEVYAWRLGKKYVPTGLMDKYNKLNEEYIKEREERSAKSIEEMLDAKKGLAKILIEKELMGLT